MPQTPWTIACKAPLSMGFPRQEYWSWLPFPPPGNLPDPGMEPATLYVSCIGKVGSLPLAPPGKTPTHTLTYTHTYLGIYIHACTRIYIHAYTHTYIQICFSGEPWLLQEVAEPPSCKVDVAESDGVGKTKELGKPILWLRWHPLAESSGRDSESGKRGRLTFHKALPISAWEVLSLLCAESLLCTVRMKTPCFR